MKPCKNCAGSRLDAKGRCHYCGAQIETTVGPGSPWYTKPEFSQYINHENLFKHLARQSRLAQGY